MSKYNVGVLILGFFVGMGAEVVGADGAGVGVESLGIPLFVEVRVLSGVQVAVSE